MTMIIPGNWDLYVLIKLGLISITHAVKILQVITSDPCVVVG